MVLQRVASSPPQPTTFTRDVLYIGSAVPLETSEGLDAIQQPLRSRYPVHDEESIQGILSTLTVTPDGIQLRYKTDPSHVVFFPFSALSLCAGVRCVKSTNAATNEITSRFVSLTQAAAEGGVGDRPSIFTTITRRTKGRQVLECHGFITVSPKDAMDLLQWTVMYHQKYKNGGGTVDGFTQMNGANTASMTGFNNTTHDISRADTSFRAAETGSLPEYPVNLVAGEPVVHTAAQGFYNEAPKEGYFYSTKKAQVKRFSLHKFSKGGAEEEQTEVGVRPGYAGSQYSLPVSHHPPSHHPPSHHPPMHHPPMHPPPMHHPPIHHPPAYQLPPQMMAPGPMPVPVRPVPVVRPVLVPGPQPHHHPHHPHPPPPPHMVYARPRFFSPPPPPAFMRAQPVPVFLPPPPHPHPQHPPPGVAAYNGHPRSSSRGRGSRHSSASSHSSSSSSTSPGRGKRMGKKYHHRANHTAHHHEDSSVISSRPKTPPTDYDSAPPMAGGRISRKEDHFLRQSYLRDLNGPSRGAMTLWPPNRKPQGYIVMPMNHYAGAPTMPRTRSVPPGAEKSSKKEKKSKKKKSTKKTRSKSSKKQQQQQQQQVGSGVAGIEVHEDDAELAMKHRDFQPIENQQLGYERSFSKSAAERAFSKSLAAETKNSTHRDAFNAYLINQNGVAEGEFPVMY